MCVYYFTLHWFKKITIWYAQTHCHSSCGAGNVYYFHDHCPPVCTSSQLSLLQYKFNLIAFTLSFKQMLFVYQCKN